MINSERGSASVSDIKFVLQQIVMKLKMVTILFSGILFGMDGHHTVLELFIF